MSIFEAAHKEMKKYAQHVLGGVVTAKALLQRKVEAAFPERILRMLAPGDDDVLGEDEMSLACKALEPFTESPVHPLPGPLPHFGAAQLEAAWALVRAADASLPALESGQWAKYADVARSDGQRSIFRKRLTEGDPIRPCAAALHGAASGDRSATASPAGSVADPNAIDPGVLLLYMASGFLSVTSGAPPHAPRLFVLARPYSESIAAHLATPQERAHEVYRRRRVCDQLVFLPADAIYDAPPWLPYIEQADPPPANAAHLLTWAASCRTASATSKDILWAGNLVL